MPSSTALYTSSEIREIEQAALAVLPSGTLMQRAGEAAAAVALELIGDPESARVLVLVGPGNNGGDALETACRLAHVGADVTALLCASLAKQPADAQAAWERARASTIRLVEAEDCERLFTESWRLVVDGLFGIGLARPITGTPRNIIEAVNRLPCPILALDVPSGLDTDTGNVVGDDAGIAIAATHTITFIGNKPGLHTASGRDYAGTVCVSALSIDDELFKPSSAELNQPALFATLLRKRQHNSHKGSFGDVTLVGGAHGMSGAIILSARAAAKCGAGRVFAAFLDDAPLYDSIHPELMCRHVADIGFASGSFVVGPGLGTSAAAHDTVKHALNAQAPVVLDADALNLIAADNELQTLASRRTQPTIMTPHPLEAARLLGAMSTSIQHDRLGAARKLANQFHCTIVLKGSGTVIATPDQQTVINPTGNPALATAGTGDVLAGMCGALLVQGVTAREAALAAVWLHGQAADRLVEKGIGPVGVTASDLIPEVQASLNALIAQSATTPVALQQS
jgi:hydroxyethylthiazole kinase-like uncharacterized protein yjeF